MIQDVIFCIGLFVVVKFFIKNRRMFMDKKAFWQAVEDLRQNIICCWQNSTPQGKAHRNLDKLVEIVTGDKTMKKPEVLQDEMTETIVQYIKDIKAAKQESALKDRAEKIIESIKAAIESDD